jgi:hypothetical protein
MNKYVILLDDILVDFLKDIKSLRYQLVLGAFGLNLYLFNNNAPASVMITALGLLTLVYGLYFQSKRHQAELEAKQAAEDMDPSTERNPDL